MFLVTGQSNKSEMVKETISLVQQLYESTDLKLNTDTIQNK